jgi:hypothetical protein
MLGGERDLSCRRGAAAERRQSRTCRHDKSTNHGPPAHASRASQGCGCERPAGVRRALHAFELFHEQTIADPDGTYAELQSGSIAAFVEAERRYRAGDPVAERALRRYCADEINHGRESVSVRAFVVSLLLQPC